MELHNLKPAQGAVKKEKRIGRGTGSGHGGTSTRGHKGDKARSGFKTKRHFEGGQMPLQMRLPKRGFKNINRVEYVPFNLSRLSQIAEKLDTNEITLAVLLTNGYITRLDKVKVLGQGKLSKKLALQAHACSATAKQAIEENGGSINLV
ncbi:MAG: 50S ribosomal protein L15 [Saprospiraceae bacterium]|nr:50S ribosomal protein L15 [Saprospiraceae bacterium]MBP7699695.1 50S ribosomal protein L15 [Saprospiraceae bacterium]